MIRPLRRLSALGLGLVLLAAAPAVEPSTSRAVAPAASVAEERVLKALEAWLRTWRTGKIDMHKPGILAKDSVAARMGVLPKGFTGELTYERELDLLCEQAAQLDSAEAVELVLEVAAAGLDGASYALDMDPFKVRITGERWITKFTGAAAKERLQKVARGEVKFDKGKAAAMRAAALRAFGLRKDALGRQDAERQLGAGEVQVRLAAAEALGMLADEESVKPLTFALEQETNDLVVEAVLGAFRRIYGKFLTAQKEAADKKPPAAGDPAAADKAAADKPAPKPVELPESSRLVVQAAVKALGRSSWRGDLALVTFLDDFRLPGTVPALIDILQRFKDHPEEVAAGKLSTLLLHRVHEVLVGYTGAVFPADAPEKWRELWEKEKTNLQIVQKTAKGSLKDGDTVAAGLFGIPVEGTRILFILDLSGSMDFPMRHGGTVARGGRAEPKDKEKDAPTRLSVAKKEMTRVIQQLDERGAFNIITYNGNPKCEVWCKEMQPSTPKNKERAIKFVDGMRALGGTNMWSGLEEGLKMKTLVYGERYDVNVDEMFVVSDGAPNLGEVTDAVEILRIVTEQNRFSRLRINTIYIDSPNEQNPRGQSISPNELMKRMAAQNGGRFVQIDG